MSAFFSIIIPTYNRAHLLTIAIESVLQQTFNDWELVIVDDGSTDNTMETVQRFKDIRIKYFYQNKSERSAARNNGIVHSGGKYICFLDSDDYYLPERLIAMFQELEKRNFPIAVLFTGLLIETVEMTTKLEEWFNSEKISDNIAMSVIHSQQVCIARTILTEFQFDNKFHIGEDMELWLRISTKYQFIYLPEQYSVVVVDHNDRSVNVKKYDSFSEQLQMLRHIFSAGHPGRNISPWVRKYLLSNCYFGIAKYHLHQGNFLKGRFYLVRSVCVNLSGNQVKYRINILLQSLPIIGNSNKLFGLLENKI